MHRNGAGVCPWCAVREHVSGTGGGQSVLPAEGECMRAVSQSVAEIDAQAALLSGSFDAKSESRVDLKRIARRCRGTIRRASDVYESRQGKPQRRRTDPSLHFARAVREPSAENGTGDDAVRDERMRACKRGARVPFARTFPN